MGQLFSKLLYTVASSWVLCGTPQSGGDVQFKIGKAKHSVTLNLQLQQMGSTASSGVFAKCDEIEFAACHDKKSEN